jgi:hexokinase
MSGDGRRLFAFLAESIKNFLMKEDIDVQRMCGLGFTFSFPVKQEGVARGRLIVWTKGFSAKGVVGRDIVGLLEKALRDEGLGSIRVSALANDTVGTLVARAYADKYCDIGVIIGTGTNACYAEAVSQIKRLGRSEAKAAARMIVNIEWGNFNKLKRTSYDRRLDKNSHNRGKQILEKMVSGMYLGEITRLVLLDLVEKGRLFSGLYAGRLGNSGTFKAEFMTDIQQDASAGLSGVKRALGAIGINSTALADRRAVQQICGLVMTRAARISAAAIAAVITKTDAGLSKKHTVAIDGSVYEKNPDFSLAVTKALRELFGRRSSRIRVVLSKDGSGIGAAIVAAVASSGG